MGAGCLLLLLLLALLQLPCCAHVLRAKWRRTPRTQHTQVSMPAVAQQTTTHTPWHAAVPRGAVWRAPLLLLFVFHAASGFSTFRWAAHSTPMRCFLHAAIDQ